MESISRLSLDEVCKKVGLKDISQGLSDTEVMERRLKSGPNKLPDSKSGWWARVKGFTVDNRQIIALISAMVMLVFTIRHDSPVSLWAHLFFVVFSIIPALYRYYGSFKEQLQNAVEDDERLVVTIRRGLPTSVKQEFLVTGDVVILKAGEAVPADIRIVEANNLRTDEAAISGYTEIKAKSANCSKNSAIDEAECLLFMGTRVVEGNCRGIIFATGADTFQWKINQYASEIGFSNDMLNKQQSMLVNFALCQIVLSIVLRIATESDEAMKYMLVSAIILLKIVENIGISRPLGDKVLSEKLLGINVFARTVEKTEFLKDIDCIYLRASDLIKTELDVTKAFLDGEVVKVSAT